ncbi:fatty acid--CoA ligase [Steroidobacter flavus]|uniref:Fatty acid--CoA ligase n=1 Tax=Steroidobacter flavus TaxID=1842136 RepID=A0ABV8T202_9GAMM
MPSLGDIARYHARHRAERIAISFEHRETSWGELDRASNRVANALTASGCRPADRIAFIGKGTDEFFELMFGAAKAGVVLVPVQWRLALPEMQQILLDAEVRVLFVGTDQFDKLDVLRQPLSSDVTVIAMEQGHAGLPRYAQWRDAASSSDVQAPVEPASVAIQLYTSGTTGVPKGVMLSHRNILDGRREGMRAGMEWNEWLDDDVNLVALPVGHVGGIAWGIVGFFSGAKTIVMREFNPAQVLDAVEHEGVSRLFVVPTALHQLLLQPRVRQIDYRRLRHILYGASPIALDLLREATQVFGCGFCQQYGMTETAGTIVFLPPEDHVAAGSQRMRAAGKAMPGVEIRVVDAHSREPLAAGQVGEVETRSVANMVGYWRWPAATAQTIDDAGWLRTGDAGYLDEDGYLYIHDRFKDMIVSGAENVYPAEVENAIYGHPAVQEVAVIGVPDEKWGETVKAIVVPKEGATTDAADIIAFSRTRIAAFKAPKSVEFVAALPKGPSGKILRRVLREPYWKGRERRVN